MHRCNSVSRQALGRVTEHIDNTSERAWRDMWGNANGYQWTRAYLDPKSSQTPVSRDWLGHFGPMMEISDAGGRVYSLPEYRAWVRDKASDRYGRKRKQVAYRGILNPPDEIQYLLWYLSRTDPERCRRAIHFTLHALRKKLRKLFETAPLQLAFHCHSGQTPL